MNKLTSLCIIVLTAALYATASTDKTDKTRATLLNYFTYVLKDSTDTQVNRHNTYFGSNNAHTSNANTKAGSANVKSSGTNTKIGNTNVQASSANVKSSSGNTQICSYNIQNGTADKLSSALKENISAKEISKWRDLVWQTWREANTQADEQQLAALRPLTDSVPHSWNVPSHLEPNAVMNYFWGTKGAKPTNGWPLFLYLHGSGPRDLEWQYGRLWALRFQDAPSAYFIPQIPQEGAWYRWWQKSKQWAWEKMLRLALCGDIDPFRIYILGISEGGYGSQRLASFYADYLAGAGPMAGGEPLKNAPAENCFNIGFSLLTGANDVGFYRNRLTRYTQQAFDSLKALFPYVSEGDSLFRHRIQLIPDRGHQIDYTLTTPWLRPNKRYPWPKTLLWEDFPMDGRHREGFYNLKVEEMPSAECDSTPETERRVRYDMEISRDTVRLSIRQVYYTTVEKDPMWGIELKFTRAYKPATKGRVRLFLDEHLVDLSRPVTVIVNGKQIFHGRLKPSVQDIANSCATFFDPLRLYPASVLIDLAQ